MITIQWFRLPYNLYCVGEDVRKPCSINQSINDSTINTQQGFMSTATYKCLSSFTNANFMTKKQPKDQDQDFETQVSRRLETIDSHWRHWSWSVVLSVRLSGTIGFFFLLILLVFILYLYLHFVFVFCSCGEIKILLTVQLLLGYDDD